MWETFAPYTTQRKCSGCKHNVNGILLEMSELTTQEWIAVGSSNLVEGWPRDPPCMTNNQRQKVKGQGHKVT